MTAKPKVSVIVPIYKVEKYLRQCVDSIRCQTLKDIQMILVDDGSPDGCPEICDAYAKEDARIQVIHKQNGGLLRARISGVEAATADYVGFVDSDDFVAPEMFETLYRAAVEHHAQMACSTFRMYWNDARMETYGWRFPSGLFAGDRLTAEFYPQWFENRREGTPGLIKAVWCKLFDRSLLKSVYAEVPQQVSIGKISLPPTPWPRWRRESLPCRIPRFIATAYRKARCYEPTGVIITRTKPPFWMLWPGCPAGKKPSLSSGRGLSVTAPIPCTIFCIMNASRTIPPRRRKWPPSSAHF